MQTRSFPSTPDGRSPAGAEIRYLIEGETLHTTQALAEDGSLRADAVLEGDPVTLLLVNLNRIRLLPALVSGRLLVFGRKPWVIPRLMSCLIPT